MAKYIKTMVDENSDTIFPRTRANAVTMSDGATNLETKIASKVDKAQTVNTKALSGDITVSAVDVPNTPAGNIAATNVQTAINELDTDKVDKVTGKGLSTEDYSTAEKSKLSGIEAGAEVNNISDVNALDLTDGGDTTLHTHDGRYYTETEVDTKDALKADKFMATNGVTNGDFSNGTTGFGSYAGNIAVANNILSLTGTGLASTASINQNTQLVLASGKKMYVRALVKAKNALTNSLEIQAFGSSPIVVIGTVVSKTSPVLDTLYPLSGVITVGSQTTNLRVLIVATYANTTNATNAVTEISYVLAIDLTSIFGAGLEPSKEQIDRLLSIYPNSWFNGTSEIANVKQLWNEKTDRILATNLVTNGDFSNGTTGWSAANGTLAVTNGKAIVTGNGAGSSVFLSPSAGGASALINDKVYISALVKVPTEADSVALQLFNNTATVEIPPSLGKPTVDTKLSTIFTLTADRTLLRGGVRCYFPSAAASNGKSFEADNISLVNLTQIFGAGKEPTAVQMDNLLANFPNSWFNGTVELASLTQFMNLINTKADKTQEAWITPTLLNGATVGSVTPQYFKDQMGIVHFKGNVKIVNNTLEFIDMPVGYRMQSTSVVFPAWQFTANIYTRVTSDDGRRLKAISTTNNNIISLDAISYKAES